MTKRISQIATIRSGLTGVQITRFQEDETPDERRVIPWVYDDRTGMDALASFIRGCLADAYHVGRRDALHAIDRTAIINLLFGNGVAPCPDGEGDQACNYCKADAIMNHLALNVLTPH